MEQNLNLQLVSDFCMFAFPLCPSLPIPLLNWMCIVLSTVTAATAIIVGFRCDEGGLE